jgi:hypothetical protein
VKETRRKVYEHIMTAGIIHPSHIISQDNLASRIIGIASETEELCNILDILVASVEFIFGAGVIDSYEEGLLPH